MQKTNDPRQYSNAVTPASPIFSFRTKVLVFSGLFLLLFAGFYYLNQTIQLAYFVPDVSVVTSKKIIKNPAPVDIEIPALNLALPVTQTEISGNTWEIAENSISHLKVSANPKDPGPIIMYGHNRNNAFGPIRWLNRGDTIIVTTADNKIHQYTVVETVQTDPDELSVFFDRDHEALYLFTCDGFMDLKRYIVIAEPSTGIAVR